MSAYTRVRDQISHSLEVRIPRVLGWVEDQPAVLRPAYYGTLFLWSVVLLRGGIIVLPALLLILLLTDRQAFWQFSIVFFLLVPAAGFIGGLVYGVIAPLVKRLGIVGSIVKFAAAAACYFTVLFFLIVPLVGRGDRPALGDPETWREIGILAIGMGTVLALSIRKDAA